MALFRIAGKADKLERINIRGFSNESEMQRITKNNLKQIFGLDFLCSEFRFGTTHKPNQNRIDILAFDSKSKSFVIIECKNKATHGAIEQGQRYLNQIKPCQRIFYGNYQKKIKNHLLMDDINWEKSKLILVAPEYTNDQRGAVDGDDPQTELWEIKKYENNTVSFSRVDKVVSEVDPEYVAPETGIEPVIPITKGERKHLERRRASKETKALYKRFRGGIPSLGDIEITPQVKTINYFVAGSRIISIVIQRTQLKMSINMPEGKLKDPKGEMRNVSKIKTWMRDNYEKVIKSDMSDEKMEYIFGLIGQSLRHHSSNKKEQENHKNSTKSLIKGRFTEEHHIDMGSKEIVALYKGLRRDIMALGDIEIKYNERYMNLMANDVIIAYVLIRKIN